MKGKLLSDMVEVVSLTKDNGTLTLKVVGAPGNEGQFKIKVPSELTDYNLSDKGLLLLVLPQAGQNAEEIKKVITDALKIT